MSGTLVVMQPTFLPWAGYFNLMAQADDFVFLDDVQLEKQSWQTRNRLIVNRQVSWVILPVQHIGLNQTIAETQVDDARRWRQKLTRTFALNYGKHPHYAEACEMINIIETHPGSGLAELNESVICHASTRLGLSARIHRASKLGADGVRTKKLVELCKILDAEDYLSPVGSAEYLAEDRFSEKSSAKLRYQAYVPRAYPQRGHEIFHSHLSILDVVANLGWKGAKKYVETGSI